jgi:hypothetical protein
VLGAALLVLRRRARLDLVDVDLADAGRRGRLGNGERCRQTNDYQQKKQFAHRYNLLKLV